jgi:hypothetical protein
LVEIDVAVPATLGSRLSTVKELDEAVERSVR